MNNSKSVSLLDIQWQYGTGIDISTGSERNKKHRYRSGVIELSVWIQLAKLVIEQEGLLDEYQNLVAFLPSCEDSAIPHTQLALQFCVSRLDLDPNWVSFIPYNQLYHPDRLEIADLVEIVPKCCNIPGLVTQSQLDRANDGMVCCPHCGKWDVFRVL